MKLFFVLAFAALLVFSTSKIRKRNRHHTKKLATTEDSMFYVFIRYTLQSIGEESGLIPSTATIDTCLPPALKTKTLNAAEQSDANSASANLDEQIGAWDTIKALLKEGIEYVCHYRDYVEEFKNYLVKLFTSRRMFFNRNKGPKAIIDFAKDNLKSLANYASKLSADLTAGVQIAKNKIKATVDEAKKFISDSFSKYLNPIIETFNSIKAKVVAFWNSPFIQKIRDYINECGKVVKDLLNLVIAAFKTIAGLVSLKPDIWFKVVLTLTCKWQTFWNALNYLIDVKKPQPYEKWMGIGRFVGIIFYLLSTVS